MSCGHWKSEYDSSPCTYCEVDRKSWKNAFDLISDLKKQLSIAKVDATVQSKACAEEMLTREILEKNLDAMADSVKHHYAAQLQAEAELLSLKEEYEIMRLDISKRDETAQCCMCGKKGLSTVEGPGGSECEFELTDGRWTCSDPCWELATNWMDFPQEKK